MQLLGFRLLDGDFAFRIQEVREVDQLPAVMPVPQAPTAIVGVVKARGEIVPVVNLRALLGLSDKPPDPASRLVFVELSDPAAGGKRLLGCIVDGTTRILRIPKHSIAPAPPELRGRGRVGLDGVARIEGGLIMILRAASLLSAHEIEQLPM